MVENVKPPSIPRYILFLLTLTGILIFIASTFSVVAAMGPAQAADGATVFKEKCVGCHTIGGGKLVGPDLAGVTERRTKEWLTKWISAPDQMLAAGDPTATELFNTYNKIAMPNLQLTPDQVAAVIAYIGSGETTTASSAVALRPAMPMRDERISSAICILPTADRIACRVTAFRASVRWAAAILGPT